MEADNAVDDPASYQYWSSKSILRNRNLHVPSWGVHNSIGECLLAAVDVVITVITAEHLTGQIDFGVEVVANEAGEVQPLVVEFEIAEHGIPGRAGTGIIPLLEWVVRSIGQASIAA